MKGMESMLINKGWPKYTAVILILILIPFCALTFPGEEKTYASSDEIPINTVVVDVNDYEVPIYETPFSETTQRDIGKLCEENHLSYELVLAIFHIEDIQDMKMDDLKIEIERLAYLRDYWANLDYPDESVYYLMLLSIQRGIEGCRSYTEDHGSYDQDPYVKEVMEYKYYLEQSLAI